MKTIQLFCYGVLALLAGLSLTGCDAVAGVVASTPTVEVPIVGEEGVVIVEGTLVPRDSVRLLSRVSGEVAEVLVKEGDEVEKDAVLLRLGNREQAEAALTAARLEQTTAKQALDDLNEDAALVAREARQRLAAAERALIEAKQKLDDLDSDTYTTDLDNAKNDVATAEDELEDAQEEWEKYDDMDEDNANRKTAKTRLEDAQKKYDDAVRKRDLLVNDMAQADAEAAAAQSAYDDATLESERRQNDAPDPNDLALVQARVTNADAQVVAAEAALSDLEIRAPFAGTVVELDLVPGETLLTNEQAVLLADFSSWYVETSDLTELDVVSIDEGMFAVVTPDAMTNLQLPAMVEEIARSSGKKGGDVTYTTRLKLSETDPRLRWGMTVEVRFEEE